MASTNRIILIDADVISHFIRANEHLELPNIFPNNPIHILDKVHAELQAWPSPEMLNCVSDLLSSKKMRLINFPDDNDLIVREYAYIKSRLFKGDGESACLAVARYQSKILASSNLKDTQSYCSMHTIDYLTTMDFLCEALSKNLFDINRCNQFINRVITARGRLPVTNMNSYTCRLINFL
jgi:hypothetical protein